MEHLADFPGKFKYGPEETLSYPQFYIIYSKVNSNLFLQKYQNTMGQQSSHSPQEQTAVLQELHEDHPGMSCMKALACMYVW